MVIRLLLRPAVLVSVVVHGAAVATAYIAIETRRPEREPLILASLATEVVPSDEPPPAIEPVEPPSEPPTVREPVIVEPPPVLEVIPEPDEPRAEAPLISLGGYGPVPVGLRTSTNRGRPLPGPGGATSVSAAVPAAPSAEPRRPGLSRLAIARSDNARPAYPADALARRLEGTVVLTFTVLSDGTVVGVSIERSSGSADLDAAAFAAATAWRYEPKLVDGAAVDEALRVPVRFRISQR